MMNDAAKQNIVNSLNHHHKITQNLYQTKIAKQGGSMSVPSQNNKSIVLIAPPSLKESYAQKQLILI